MGILTKNERDGLEDVFLSIHTSTNKYKKLKDLSALIMTHETTLNFKKLLKQAKYGLKETKNITISTQIRQKEEKFKQINYKVSVAELFQGKS